MKSLDILIAEHDTIKFGMNLIAQAIAKFDSGQSVPEEFPAWAAQFLRQFGDKCHHAKEEDLLFPLLKARGIPVEGGPIGCMLQEHDTGRDCVRRMREASESDPLDENTFVAAAKEFIPLLREHIDKENNILYQMAANVMTEADDAELTAQFSKVEKERSLEGMHERCTAEIERWEGEMGPMP